MTSTSISDLNDDVLDIVCAFANEADHPSASLSALSLTDKRMHALCVPHLFRTIKLRLSGTKEWERGAARLKTWNPELGPFVRSCDVHITVSYRRGDDPRIFLSDLAARLPEFLGTLTRLRRIACTIPEHDIARFDKALCNHASTLSFPLVKELCGAASRILVQFCPNVKYFDMLEPDYAIVIPRLLMRLLQHDFHTTQNVTCLGFWVGLPNTLEAARDCFPNLRMLMFRRHCTGHSFYDLLPILASFSAALKVLVLPRAAELHVGYNPPWYEMLYRGPSGKELRKSMKAEEKNACEDVAKVVFSACKHLEELWVGTAFRARVERREGHINDIQYDLNLDWEDELAKLKRENGCCS